MEQAQFDTIEAQVDGMRGDLILNRPQHLNPLGLDTLRELSEAAGWLNSHPALKVLVVSGRGRAFSAGADMSVFVPGEGSGPAMSPHDAADAGRVMADALESIEAISIARIQGHCVGGGLVLAAACDLRIAATDTRFRIPEIDLGIPLGWGGIPRLIRAVGPAVAKEWVMTCRSISAQEALTSGFVNRVVPPAELDQAVEDLAALLIEKPRLALLSTKRQVDEITSRMVHLAEAAADADLIIAGLSDPEGRASALRYVERLRSKASGS